MLRVLRTVIVSLEGAIKKSTANVRMPRWRKKECKETKTGISIMLHFMQLADPRHMDIHVQNLKHKSHNTEVTIFEHRTQNICIQNTVSHIGFRIIPLSVWIYCLMVDQTYVTILFAVSNMIHII